MPKFDQTRQTIPDISIIIVTYNNKDLLQNCLNSLYENTSNSVSFETFVVDNNSTDNTLQMLLEKFPLVKVIDNQENFGFAKANNQAMRLARGRYILLLNNDTFVLNDSLEKMLSFMDQPENREIGAIAPRLLEADGKTIQIHGSTLSRKIWLATEPISVKFITGAVFMLRKEVYKNVGELDEKFFFYNEDLDFCKRILKNNWKIFYFPESSVIHYGGGSKDIIPRRILIEGIKGGLYFTYKHYKLIFPVYLLLILIYSIMEITMNILKLIFVRNKKAHWERLTAFCTIFFITLLGKYK